MARFKFFMLLCMIGCFACSGTRNTGASGKRPSGELVDSGYELQPAEDANQSNINVHPNKDKPSNISLNEMIQRLPGVRSAGGQGAYARFVVDGTSGSFMSGSDPLFVVNGNVIGTDYSIVFAMVDPKKVVSVSVLKGSDASIYGSRGGNGVIVIRTAL